MLAYLSLSTRSKTFYPSTLSYPCSTEHFLTQTMRSVFENQAAIFFLILSFYGSIRLCMIRNTLIKAFFFLQGKDAIYRYICLSLLYNELFNIRKITEEKKKADVNIWYQISLSHDYCLINTFKRSLNYK